MKPFLKRGAFLVAVFAGIFLVNTQAYASSFEEEDLDATLRYQTKSSWYDGVGLQGLFSTVEPATITNLGSILHDLSDAPYSSACKRSVLEQMGWQISINPSAERGVINGGNPCDNTDVAESVAQGELRLVLPGQGGEEKLSAVLNDALSSKATICLFKMKVSDAVQRATSKLIKNENYEFRTGSPYIYVNSSEWERPCRNSMGSRQCLQASESGARALEVFAREESGTDCQAGLQVAELFTLRETLGDAEFDRQIAPWEVAVGPWEVVNASNNIIWAGARNLETVLDRDATEFPKQGIHALQGVSGYIGNVYGEEYLENPVDRGENFLTVSVTQSAALRLQSVGGFKFFNDKNEEIYRIARGVYDKHAIKYAADDYNLNEIELSGSDRALLKQIQVLLKDPFYRGYRVFVHPLGIMTMGEHIARLLERNPRTPYAFRLYPTRYNGGLASLYVKSLLDQCR